MPSSNNTNPLDKAVNLRQLKMSHDSILDEAMRFDETADPASEAVVNEYERLTANLYQALEDAQQVVEPAQAAAAQAQASAEQANQATAAASAAASAADAAASQVEDAKGGYKTLAARLDATEMGLIESNDPMSLLN